MKLTLGRFTFFTAPYVCPALQIRYHDGSFRRIWRWRSSKRWRTKLWPPAEVRRF